MNPKHPMFSPTFAAAYEFSPLVITGVFFLGLTVLAVSIYLPIREARLNRENSPNSKKLPLE